MSGIWTQGLEQVISEKKNTVTFKFREVNTTLIEYISNIFIVPKHVWYKVKDPVTWTGNVEPVGTGPFKYKKGTFSELAFKVMRNPLYWKRDTDGQVLPYIDGIQYISTTNEQIGFKLARGYYDWAGYFVSNIEQVYVRTDPKNHKYWLPEGNLIFLNLNNAKWPFNNYKLRLAVAFALDQAEITRIMASGAVPANVSGVKSNYHHLAKSALEKINIEQDDDYARTLIEEAGYKINAKGIYEKNDKALTLKLYVPTGWTDWITCCDVIVSQLKEAGIEAIVTQASWPSPYKDNLYNGNYEMCIGIAVTGTNTHYQFDKWIHSKNWAPIGKRSTNYYGMRYKNKTIDSALDAYKKEIDKQKQEKVPVKGAGS